VSSPSANVDPTAPEQPPTPADVEDGSVSPSEQDQPPRKRVLMLTHRLPYPPDRGDRIRSYHILKVLSQHFDVALAATSEEPVWLQHHVLLRKMATRVCLQPIWDKYSKVRGALALVAGRAVTPACFYRQSLAETILQWHEEKPFDLVLTYCTGMIQYARLLLPHGQGEARHLSARAKHVLDLVDVDSVKWEAYARNVSFPMSLVYSAEARRLRRIESGKLDHFDAVTVVSEAEAQAYRQNVGEHPGLRAVNNGVDLDYFGPLPDSTKNQLVFVGVLNYRPNVQGIIWFVENVMPILRQRVRDLKLQIVGRHPSPRVTELGSQPGVEVVGSVPDVRNYMQDASVVIAPLQIARGVQNKVLEAMSSQKPVVCSPEAAEGIQATPGEHFAVARTPQEWADRIERLLQYPQERQKMAAAGRAQVERHYNWNTQLQPLVNLIHDLTGSQA
jgi:sugar transferase (PEP-CTERM/EpsH1 system associated)